MISEAAAAALFNVVMLLSQSYYQPACEASLVVLFLESTPLLLVTRIPFPLLHQMLVPQAEKNQIIRVTVTRKTPIK